MLVVAADADCSNRNVWRLVFLESAFFIGWDDRERFCSMRKRVLLEEQGCLGASGRRDSFFLLCFIFFFSWTRVPGGAVGRIGETGSSERVLAGDISQWVIFGVAIQDGFFGFFFLLKTLSSFSDSCFGMDWLSFQPLGPQHSFRFSYNIVIGTFIRREGALVVGNSCLLAAGIVIFIQSSLWVASQVLNFHSLLQLSLDAFSSKHL